MLAPPVALPDGGNDLYILQAKFRAQFAADVPEADAALMAATQRPIMGAASIEPSATATSKTAPVLVHLRRPRPEHSAGRTGIHGEASAFEEDSGSGRRLARRDGCCIPTPLQKSSNMSRRRSSAYALKQEKTDLRSTTNKQIRVTRRTPA